MRIDSPETEDWIKGDKAPYVVKKKDDPVIDLNWKPKLNPDGTIPFNDEDDEQDAIDAFTKVGLQPAQIQKHGDGHDEKDHGNRGFSLTPKQRAGINRIRREIVEYGECNSTGGPSCGVTSEEVAYFLGGKEYTGAYRADDGTIPEHSWVVMSDGTIIDATGDQFGMPAIQVIAPSDPLYVRYLDQLGDDIVVEKHGGTHDETDEPDSDTEVEKLSPAFGNRSKRQAQLVARLKTRRKYPKPVRGGTGKQARTRRKKF